MSSIFLSLDRLIPEAEYSVYDENITYLGEEVRLDHKHFMVKVEMESGITKSFYAEASHPKIVCGDKKFFCSAEELDVLYNLLLFAVGTSRYEMFRNVDNLGGSKYLFTVNGKSAYCYNSFAGNSHQITKIMDEIFSILEEGIQSERYNIELSKQIVDMVGLTYKFKDMYFNNADSLTDKIIFKKC